MSTLQLLQQHMVLGPGGAGWGEARQGIATPQHTPELGSATLESQQKPNYFIF